jgi:hypothetical protein
MTVAIIASLGSTAKLCIRRVANAAENNVTKDQSKKLKSRNLPLLLVLDSSKIRPCPYCNPNFNYMIRFDLLITSQDEFIYALPPTLPLVHPASFNFFSMSSTCNLSVLMYELLQAPGTF